MKNIGVLVILMTLFASCVSKRSLEMPLGSKKGYSVTEYVDMEMGEMSGFYGFSMQKVNEKTVRYIVNGDKTFDPASNIKMLTLNAAMTYLEDQVSTFRYYDEGGRRYLLPLGDPTLFHPDFDNSTIRKFLKSGPDTLVIDLSHQEEINRFGPGWAWDDYMYEFSAERSIMPLYGNTVRFLKKDGDLVAIPKVFEVETVSKPLKYIYERAQDKNNFMLRTSWAGVNPYNIPFIWSEEVAKKLIAKESGKVVLIEINGNMSDRYKEVVKNVGVDTILRKMFKESNNFLAEQLMINIGYDQLNAKSAELCVYYADKMLFSELDFGYYKWVDGSGLSPYNRMSPDFAVNFLDYLFEKKGLEELKAFFPKAGEPGSMSNWTNTEDEYIWAKTGNKSGVSNLSGYLEVESGDVYIFSLMVTNFTEKNTDIHRKMEKILNRLRKDL